MTKLHKVEDKRRLSSKIAERLRKSPEVRPFPAAVAQLTSACQDPNTDIRTFESIIECDAALSGKLLRMANSPLFCPAGQVKTISHAVALLGIRKLKSVAMSVAGSAMFSSGSQAQDQRRYLWNHSVGCAVVAQCVARHVPDVEPDEAFLAGVFHDIGKLLFYDTIPDEYSEVDAEFNGERLVEEEDFLFGTTHELVGLASADSWKLPSEIRSAIGWHHRPAESESCPAYAQVINLADRLAKLWGIGSDVMSKDELQDGEQDVPLTKLQSHLEPIQDEARRLFDETVAAAG